MKTVLITGTSRGLGLELLKVFLENNWTVFALSRNTKSFENETEKFPTTCIPVKGDVTDDSTIQEIQNALKSRTKQLDVLINNAGNVKKCFGINHVTSNDLDEHFQVHVSGVFRVIKACLPYLHQSDSPFIINISSRKGSINKVNSGAYRILLPYQIAKCAQNMLTACLNQELKGSKIKVFAIHPGSLKTEVAPPDADTEPAIAAQKLFHWIINDTKPSTDSFYNIIDGSILEW
ncbi:MAG: hypothetical protein A2X13_08255 [Bacteroidetes bacterium GWC2_33_15]|nr:MAG: hypothetical protein A2X10_10085 [Bacteroidetes bacterium GWA2_33_15]OFX51447.1 MAG: hypothetical protein A2X13_08255 [Bacteroidetes bacterium GWC2_33_15]OFX65807.1 MAG: hypothetical protein A2X15_13525 [Bacteroidetes bacterium GWB2_32_14]OFX69475.1 MAG: hypothetical protein A2X14_09835 [Bacteroidetes bacterium GWD2_33_33]HAN17731.1 short-chain dehydrogenase [Bacteroidales bacterium]